MTDMFSVNVSAMNSALIGLQTTENNIANASTPGYNREQIVANALPSQLTGSGYVGEGVGVTSVQRVYNQFLSGQVNQQQSQSSQLDTYYSQIQQVDNMLSSSSSGVTPALQSFFNAINSVSSQPNSMAARQTMLSTAQSLTSTFQLLGQNLTNINSSINGQITTSVSTINSDAQQIATLNQSIVNAVSVSGGQPPNNLLDQRDQLIADLNKQINVNVTNQGNGSFNLTTGNGQLLVVGGTAYGLSAVKSSSDPSQLVVAAGNANGALMPIQQNTIQGGALGGLLAFRSQSLQPAQNMLGLVATGIAGTFNQQNQLGMDLNGAMSGQTNSFFADPVPVVNNNTSNAGNAVVTATITDYSKLTSSNYSLSYDGTNYTLTRLSDNTSTSSTTMPLTMDGVNIDITSGTPNKGDSFIIQPTVNGAINMSVALTDLTKIAAASPIMTNAKVTNAGTGQISAGAVNSPPPANPNLLDSVTVTFSDSTHYSVTDTTTGTALAGSTTYDPNAGATLSFNGWTAQITGSPVAKDTFTVGHNTNATSDNRNALLLANLQTKKVLQGATANYEDVYSQLVSQVGNQTNQLKVTSTAQTSLLNNTIAAQQSVSGVNLDEEAANLLRYQQAYQAAGKAMQIASTLFDTLLSIGK